MKHLQELLVLIEVPVHDDGSRCRIPYSLCIKALDLKALLGSGEFFMFPVFFLGKKTDLYKIHA